MTGRPESIDRAMFLHRAGGLLTVAFLDRSTVGRLLARPATLDHPEPRPGITAERVLTAEALGTSRKAKVADAYAAARSWPAIFDGIACGCGCGGPKGMHRSLLVCFETLQPTGCASCQMEAELVARLARQDKPLADIRKAVDKEFS
jgi:hypothetical protein